MLPKQPENGENNNPAVNLDDAKKIFENGWNKLANITKTTANDFSKNDG